MKVIQLLFLCLFISSLVGCTTEEPLVTEFLTYQVTGEDGTSIVVEIEDRKDGTGFLTGQLVFDNTDSKFDATYNYVSDERTNFVIDVAEGEVLSGDANGSGFFTSDSIDFDIQRTIGGFTIDEHYTGNR